MSDCSAFITRNHCVLAIRTGPQRTIIALIICSLSSNILLHITSLRYPLQCLFISINLITSHFALYTLYNQQYFFIILTFMNYLDKIKATFQKNGLNPSTRIKKNEFEDFLNAIMNGEQFEQAVADEIWKEASKGSSTVFVEDICTTIMQAQNIINGKLSEFNEQIASLQKSKREAESTFGKRSVKVTQIQSNLEAIYEQKAEFEQDLRILTVPFGINGPHSLKVRQSRREEVSQDIDLSRSVTGQKRASEQEELKLLLYLTLIFGVLQLIIIYGKYDFLNLIVLTCLLFIYLLNHFDSMYMKTTLILLIGSQVLDVIWLFLYAEANWSPPSVGNHSNSEIAYLRFIVFFTVVIICLKIPLGYLLYQYRNAGGEHKYNLQLGIVKIVLTPNKINPITRGLTNSLGPSL